jgi:hypothetical protein
VTDQWFSPGIPVSSTNKTDPKDITQILLTFFALNTITPNPPRVVYLILQEEYYLENKQIINRRKNEMRRTPSFFFYLI